MEGGTLTITTLPAFEPGISGWEDKFPWAQLVSATEFWSCLQALAWITTRSTSFAEVLGAYDRARDDQGIMAFGILQWVASSRHCKCGLSNDEDGEEGWERCLCIRDAGRMLLEKIRLGEIAAYDAESQQEMGLATFVNIDMDPTGRAWIDLSPAAWFSSVAVKSAILAGEGGQCSSITPFTDEDRQAWMMEQPMMSGDRAHKLFQEHARYDGTKQLAFRDEWKQVKGTKQGRPPKTVR